MTDGSVSTRDRKLVVVVGGGIAGLYSAMLLAKQGRHTVRVLELKDVCGGRIETGDLGGFKAEFGPMRFELDIEPLFRELCQELGLGSTASLPARNTAAPWGQFTRFAQTSSRESPIAYPLAPDERYGGAGGTPLSALNLLRLGIYRMLGKETQPLALDGDVVPLDSNWLHSLHDGEGSNSYDELRQTARLRGKSDAKLLWYMGFWNAIQSVLSPGAVLKILNQGTFYHLMPENPNAIEWAVFWLRLFTGAPLYTLPAGVDQVTKELSCWLAKAPNVTVETSCEVVAVRPSEDSSKTLVDVVYRRIGEQDSRSTIQADHVVLALPKHPLLPLAKGFPSAIRAHLDSVIAFPLLKVFVVIDTPPWWEKVPVVHDGAWLVPTREVHWISRGQETMALLYMDRPNSGFWQPLVTNPGQHDRAEYANNLDLKRTLAEWLADFHRTWVTGQLNEDVSRRKLHPAHYFVRILAGIFEEFEEELRSVLPATWQAAKIWGWPDWIGQYAYQSISNYAIRDWSRDPFGAGCHAWAPGARSWEVRKALRGFSISATGATENIHICGEAYSDYQGFIEGALRSATDAVQSIGVS